MEDHDQRLKTVLREFFAEFIRLFFPQWAERFDFTAIEWLDKETFSDPPQGEMRELDLVAKLRVHQPAGEANESEPWLVLVHVEIEARDSVAPLRPRMFDYYSTLRRRHGLPVLPIGLYLRVGLDGIGWDVYEERFWDHVLVRFEYAYIGLPALDALQYVEGQNWLGVALTALMRVPEARRLELKAQATQRVCTSPENDWRRFLLCEFLDAYMPLEGSALEEYQRLLQSEKYREARAMAMTTYERGMAKGIEDGQRRILERQLERRFGPLSPTVLARLTAWPAEKLAELSDALETAKSLKELGLED